MARAKNVNGNGHSNGQNIDTTRRLILWGLQVVVMAMCGLLWQMIQEMRVDLAGLRASMAAKETQVAELKIKVVANDEVIKEIRSDLKLINTNIQDMRISLQQRSR